MQMCIFNTGHFALFRIRTSNGRGKLHAWFSADGDLVDTQRIDARGRTIRTGKEDTEYARLNGKRYAAFAKMKGPCGTFEL